MFDNIGTAIVQAIGFFVVFGFFVYQLLSDGKQRNNTELKPYIKKQNESKVSKDNSKKKELFGTKKQSIKLDDKPRRKGLFGKKVERLNVLEKPKKKGWFR